MVRAPAVCAHARRTCAFGSVWFDKALQVRGHPGSSTHTFEAT